MKTLSTLASLSIASLFSLSASAADLSQFDYEYYAQSSVWPGQVTAHSSSMNMADIQSQINSAPTAAGMMKTEDLSHLDYEDYVQSSVWPSNEGIHSTSRSVAIEDIQSRLDDTPPAAGAHHVGDAILYDLLGENIHEQ